MGLEQRRWYPTGTRFGDKVIASGGTESLAQQNSPDTVPSTYEVASISQISGASAVTWDKWGPSPQDRIYAGPAPYPNDNRFGDKFTIFPHLHVISDGTVAYTGFGKDNGKWTHNPQSQAQTYNYNVGQGPFGGFKFYGTSVIYPIDLNLDIRDHLVRIGGSYIAPPRVGSNEVEVCVFNNAPTSSWSATTLPQLGKLRSDANSVLLPDGSILVMGGASGEGGTEWLDGEYWKLGMSAWQPTNQMLSTRVYHSSALLLPSGKVLVAGGESRAKDYQIFVPPYLHAGQRPTITLAPATLGYDLGQSGPLYTVTFSDIALPITAEHIVLMRPGAVSHHSCMEQRMIRLLRYGAPTQSQIQFRGPPSEHYAPKGYYMLFLVNSVGVLSVATWVYVG